MSGNGIIGFNLLCLVLGAIVARVCWDKAEDLWNPGQAQSWLWPLTHPFTAKAWQVLACLAGTWFVGGLVVFVGGCVIALGQAVFHWGH